VYQVVCGVWCGVVLQDLGQDRSQRQPTPFNKGTTGRLRTTRYDIYTSSIYIYTTYIYIMNEVGTYLIIKYNIPKNVAQVLYGVSVRRGNSKNKRLGLGLVSKLTYEDRTQLFIHIYRLN
jgi:hypothetical protein